MRKPGSGRMERPLYTSIGKLANLRMTVLGGRMKTAWEWMAAANGMTLNAIQSWRLCVRAVASHNLHPHPLPRRQGFAYAMNNTPIVIVILGATRRAPIQPLILLIFALDAVRAVIDCVMELNDTANLFWRCRVFCVCLKAHIFIPFQRPLCSCTTTADNGPLVWYFVLRLCLLCFCGDGTKPPVHGPCMLSGR